MKKICFEDFVEQVFGNVAFLNDDGNLDYYFEAPHKLYWGTYKMEDLHAYLLSKGFTQEQLNGEEPAYDNFNYETMDNQELIDVLKNMYNEYQAD